MFGISLNSKLGLSRNVPWILRLWANKGLRYIQLTQLPIVLIHYANTSQTSRAMAGRFSLFRYTLEEHVSMRWQSTIGAFFSSLLERAWLNLLPNDKCRNNGLASDVWVQRIRFTIKCSTPAMCCIVHSFFTAPKSTWVEKITGTVAPSTDKLLHCAIG